VNLVPPIELITENKIGVRDKENFIDEYKRMGTFIATMLKNGAGLQPESDVLDMGCGTGRVARPLTEYLRSISSC
jgi:ubiquinone/menaquinone biosynthesis C-methylase UbiE